MGGRGRKQTYSNREKRRAEEEGLSKGDELKYEIMGRENTGIASKRMQIWEGVVGEQRYANRGREWGQANVCK